MIRAIIFDFDGVLIDSENSKDMAISQVLQNAGIKPDLKFIASGTGKSNQERYKLLAGRYRLKMTFEQYVKLKDAFYAKLIPEIPPIQSNIEFLKMVADAGVMIGLVSGCEDVSLQKNIDRFQLRSYFHEIMSEKNVTTEHLRSKPFPDSYLSMANKLGVKPEECLVVEDSETGIQAAKAAGMLCMNVGPKQSKVADFNVKDASKLDLKALLEGKIVYVEMHSVSKNI